MVKTFVTRGLSIFYYFLKVKKRLICISNPIQTILDLKLESSKALLCENNCYPIISILHKSFFVVVKIAVLMYFFFANYLCFSKITSQLCQDINNKKTIGFVPFFRGMTNDKGSYLEISETNLSISEISIFKQTLLKT